MCILVTQGGLPASSGTRQFAQELLDKLPGKSGSNGRPPIAALPSQRTQEAAARAFLKQNAQYALLEEEEDEDAAPVLPAPTTAPVPKKREKKLRKERAGNARIQCGTHGISIDVMVVHTSSCCVHTFPLDVSTHSADVYMHDSVSVDTTKLSTTYSMFIMLPQPQAFFYAAVVHDHCQCSSSL